MSETNSIINSSTEWDLNSLVKKLVEIQEALLESQEKTIVLEIQIRELERVARDTEDFKLELSNQAQLLADKTRENKQLHQELSHNASQLNLRIQEIEELKALTTDIQHQLKTCQSERDLLAVMLTEAEQSTQLRSNSSSSQQVSSGWLSKYLKGK